MSGLHYKKKTSQIIIETPRDHLFKFSYDTFIQSHPYNQYHKLACFVTFVAATVFFELKFVTGNSNSRKLEWFFER